MNYYIVSQEILIAPDILAKLGYLQPFSLLNYKVLHSYPALMALSKMV